MGSKVITGLHVTHTGRHTHSHGPQIKDTDSEHVDPIDSVLVVVPINCMVAAQKRSGLIGLMLQDQEEEMHEHQTNTDSSLQVYVQWLTC